MNQLVLELNNVEKSYMSEEILTIEKLKVYENEKIGIVGKNGSGKSTLLNLIAGELTPDAGTINRQIDFHYFKQIEEAPTPDFAKVDAEYLSRLQVPKHSPFHYSGGEQTRARLAEYFSMYSFGLLMDEPTTHLDEVGVQFLVDQLKYYYGTLLVVSHNRYFLDEVADAIWEVEDGRVTVYKGNYSQYQEQKAQALAEQAKEYEQYVREKQRLERAAAEKQEQAEKMSRVSAKQKDRAINPGRLDASKSKDTVQKAAHKTAQAILKRADQLEAAEKPPLGKMVQFPEPKSLAIHHEFPIMGHQVTIQKGENVLFEEASFQFPLGKRIGIVGPNGSGKTTLMRHILNEGEGITLSKKVVFSVYQQMDYQLFEDDSMLEFLMKDSEFEEPVIRSVLNNLGFEQKEIVKKSVKDLSGGEATRLVIAKLFSDPSNVLVLDEPTNFIDVQTIEALELLMKSYKGTILFTSHDKYFMENVADQIWRVEDRRITLVKY